MARLSTCAATGMPRPSLSRFWLPALLLLGTTLCDTAFAAFRLCEVAPAGRFFRSVVVQWTDKNKKVVATSTVTNVAGVCFNSADVEKVLNLKRGTIRDWKQTRVLDNGFRSTLEGVFARLGTPDPVLSYDEAYAQLGLNMSSSFYLPDFGADLDNNGTAETELYSAINLYDLATNHPQFINNQAFNFGQTYTVADYQAYGFVFSLNDNITWDPVLGYVTATPAPLSTSIVADSEHITEVVPEPSTITLFATGALGLLRFVRRGRKSG